VRLRVAGLPKGDYVVLDDISVTTGAPARLDTIDGDFPGYYYARRTRPATRSAAWIPWQNITYR
jgi:hypothetical protein